MHYLLTTIDRSFTVCTVNGATGRMTELGCMPISVDAFVAWVLPIAIGLLSGIALLFLAYGAMTIMTSQDNPQRLRAGKQIMFAAIGGVLFVVFSVFIVRFLGYDIFGIPNFAP